ncbi:hypothetical protein OVA29_04475 [Exiguobacterium sp. SL14]|nr:hypothetical protein [Exiguobacterium sp. SL14]MCY1690160.1 hypothetical protein [Exiguobacterium sp. SL14]
MPVHGSSDGTKAAIQAMLGVRLSWLHRLTYQTDEEQLWASRAIEKYLPLYDNYTSVKESGIGRRSLATDR